MAREPSLVTAAPGMATTHSAISVLELLKLCRAVVPPDHEVVVRVRCSEGAIHVLRASEQIRFDFLSRLGEGLVAIPIELAPELPSPTYEVIYRDGSIVWHLGGGQSIRRPAVARDNQEKELS